MVALKVPSLQHLARNWRSDPEHVKRLLVQLAKNSPTFNYAPLFDAVRDMLVFGVSYDQIAEGFRRHISRKAVRTNFLEILALMRDHFGQIDATFVHVVQPRYYPVARDLMVPFQPPVVYGVNGRIFFPWLSFWRTNPLSGKQLSLFVSIVEEILLQDPDLEDATFQIVDFSAPTPKQPRVLTVHDTQAISRISRAERAKMLSVFAEGYVLAKAELEATKASVESSAPVGRESNQPGLFDRRS